MTNLFILLYTIVSSIPYVNILYSDRLKNIRFLCYLFNPTISDQSESPQLHLFVKYAIVC